MPERDGETIPHSSLALLAALSFFWGLNWPAMKAAMVEFQPWTFRAVCIVVGTAGLFLFARLARQSLAVPRRDWAPLVLASLFNTTAWHLLSAYGISSLSSGRSAIVAYTMPLWATLLSAAFLGERITAAKVLGLALGLGGLVFLIERESAALEHAPLGALLMLGAALAWAIGSVLIKRHHWSMSSFALTGWLLAVGGAPIVIGAGMVEGFVWNRPGVAPSAIGILGFVYSATVAMLFCHWGWIVLLQQLPASVASIAILFIPVVGVWSSALLLGEPVGAPEIIGLASIVAALAIVLGPRLPSRR